MAIVSLPEGLTLEESMRKSRERELDPLQRLVMEVLHEAVAGGTLRLDEFVMWERVYAKIAELPEDEKAWFRALPDGDEHSASVAIAAATPHARKVYEFFRRTAEELGQEPVDGDVKQMVDAFLKESGKTIGEVFEVLIGTEEEGSPTADRAGHA